VDLGCGVGLYGEMIRERFLQRVLLTAVDGYEPYIKHQRVRYCYDYRVLADVFAVVEGRVRLRPFDCVLCMDVVEHFEKGRALLLLDWLMSNPVAYISTPMFEYEQGDENGNPLERHQCFFTEKELTALGWVLVKKKAVGREKEIGAFRNVR
jgi:2-polyprenyl-3-methyl-5-hydroxy-6-metoxy-1,4-benzoquinol methylase